MKYVIGSKDEGGEEDNQKKLFVEPFQFPCNQKA